MAGQLQPLGKQFAITDSNGNPTDYFIKWAQQRQEDIVASATDSDVTTAINAWAAGRTLNAGNGLSGGGDLSADRTFNVGTASATRIVVNPDNIDLAFTGVTPGTYNNASITVDAYGRITSVAAGTSNYVVPGGWTTTPTTSEILMQHTFTETVVFPGNWSGVRSRVGTNPTATFVMDVQRSVGTGAFSSIGSFSFSTSGVLTATTTAGAAMTFNAGDTIRWIAPAVADTTMANFSLSIKGTR